MQSLPQFCLLAAMLAGCSAPPTVASLGACPPSSEPLAAQIMPPQPGEGVGVPTSFTYEVLEQPPAGVDESVDTIQMGAMTMRVQPDTLIVSFEADEVEMELPEGKLPGIQAHHALIEPVLRDFNLEVVEQSRIPIGLQPVQAGPEGGVQPPPPITRWKVRPSFLVRVVGADTVPLTTLKEDATLLGIRGDWVFQRRRTAGLFTRFFQVLRRKNCYGIQNVGPNSLASPL